MALLDTFRKIRSGIQEIREGFPTTFRKPKEEPFRIHLDEEASQRFISKFQAKPISVSPTTIKEAIPGILQAGPRIGVAAVTQFGIPFTGKTEPTTFTPRTGIERFVLGKEPIKPLAGIGEEFAADIGISEEKAKKFGLPIGVGLLAGELIPGGGGKKALIKFLAKSDNIRDITRVVRSLGIRGSEVRKAAATIVKETDEKVVQRIIDVAPKARKVIEPISKEVPTQRLISVLREARPLRGVQQDILFAQERARRVAKVVAVGEKVGGEAGFFAQLGQLKGKLPKIEFESIRKAFSQGEIDSLFDQIQKTKALLPLEHIVAKRGLLNLLEGGIPTNNELDLLAEIFPRNLIDAILSKRKLSTRIWDAIGKAANLPRAIVTTVDLSAPLRQGIFLIGRPKQFVPAFKDMFRFFASEKAYEGLVEGIKLRQNHRLMKQSGLALTDLSSSLTNREEAFMSNWAEKIPGFGRLARASNRAYSGFLNKLRADTFDDIIKNTKQTGKNLTDRELFDVSRFINAATGRGNLFKVLEGSAPALNAMFFSPRLIASRLNLLNPVFYASLSPVARKEALKSLLSFGAISGTILGLAKMGGAEVGTDPRSADFGKIRIGNTRWDVLGGFQQYLRLVSQLWSGEIVSSTTGRTLTLGEGFRPLTKLDIGIRFLKSKQNPVVSFITGWIDGTNFMGEDFDVPTEVINRFIPFVMQDLFELAQEEGAEGIMLGIPAIFGVGIQTYGRQEVVFGESQIGEPTAQVRPVQDFAEKMREFVLGKIRLGTSKGFSIEAYYDQLSNLPPEEATEIFDKIAEANPELAQKIIDIVRDRERGITVHDKDLKAKGVQSGDRAQAIVDDFNKLETPAEKDQLWNEYVDKGVITKEVARQVKKILDGKTVEDISGRGLFGLFADYTKAFTIDPGNAFKALFTKEKLGVVQGNLVELQRFYGIHFTDKGGSEEFKRRLMTELEIPLSDIENWKLEHITPVKAGGSTDEENLVLVNNVMHDFYTPIDIAVGNAVKAGKITRKEADKLMRDFKVDKVVTAEEVINFLTR